MKNSHLFEAILKEDFDEIESNDFEEEDIGCSLGNVRGLRRDIYDGAYDSRISDIGNMEEESVPNDARLDDVVESIMQEWTGDIDYEDAAMVVRDSLEDAVLDRWYSIYS